MSTQHAVDVVTRGYRERVDQIRTEQAELVAALVSEVDAVVFDRVSGHFTNVSNEAIGALGADAANMILDEEEQEAAIMGVEDWVYDNVTNAGIEANVLCAIWGYGPERAAADIRMEIANFPSPAA